MTLLAPVPGELFHHVSRCELARLTSLAACSRTTCTVFGSPFNLTNIRQGSTLSFELNGNFVDLSDGKAHPMPYHGIAIAQFVGTSRSAGIDQSRCRAGRD